MTSLKKNFNKPLIKGGRILSLAVFSAFILYGCKSKTEQEKLHIAVAANVQYAFREIKDAFKKKTGIAIEYSIGSSGKLTTQIQNGAPFDLFLSANMKYPRALLQSGHAIRPLRVYARGKVVVWSHKKSINIAQWQKLLQSSKLQKIALANPRNAPYGIATLACLKKLKLYEKNKDRIIMGESIAQTNQFIISEGADLGFTAKSVVLSPKVKGIGKWSELPSNCYSPIEQGIVLLKRGKKIHAKESLKFFDFMFSPVVQKILARYGYEGGSSSVKK